MSTRQVAFDSILAFASELKAGMPAAEQAALRALPRGGATVIRVLKDYEDRLKQLADRCAQQFKWVDDQSHIHREWLHATEWRAFCEDVLSDCYRCANNRVNPVVSSLGVGTGVLTHTLGELEKLYDSVRRKLATALDAGIAESKSKSRGDGLSIASRLFWLVVGAAIGVALTLARQRF